MMQSACCAFLANTGSQKRKTDKAGRQEETEGK
jgi:hypothetical protein